MRDYDKLDLTAEHREAVDSLLLAKDSISMECTTMNYLAGCMDTITFLYGFGILDD